MRMTRSFWMLLFLFECRVGLAAQTDVDLDLPVRTLKYGRDFRLEIEKKLWASWQNVPLRSVLRRISDDRKLSILLDRRIDPTQLVTAQIKNESVLAAVRLVAKNVGADVRVVGSTIYVGPPVGCGKLRTLIELRSQQLLSKSSKTDLRLTKRRVFHWNDLDAPIDLIREVANRNSLELSGFNRIPHDLWAGVTLPSVNAIESLSLILIQFDLTFDWIDGTHGVSIVAAPKFAVIEKSYSMRNRSADRTLEKWRQHVGDFDANIQGTRLVVRTTVEKHEAIKRLLKPTTSRKKSKVSTSTPLVRQLFTFRRRDATVRSIMQELEKVDIRFEYDSEKLASAGVDFEKRITIDVTKAKADEFFRKLFDPLQLEFTLKDRTVTLKLPR